MSELRDVDVAMNCQQSTSLIWEAFADPLRAYITRRVSGKPEAEDVLQDVFLKIHTRLHTLRQEDRLAAWLYSIARNAIIDHYRDRTRLASPVEVPTSDESDESEASAMLAERMPYFVNACLPEKYARALALADLEGLTQQEVAATLGLSVSGAKSRVQRARRMLREAFLRCCQVELDARNRVIGYAARGDCSGTSACQPAPPSGPSRCA